jgi:hypothetical protein
VRARFTLPAFHATWPEDLWHSGTLIYSETDPTVSLPTRVSPSDRLLRFNSRFESGNLLSAYSLGGDAYHLVLKYDPNRSETCQWFYFQLSNVRCDIRYHFYISGFHKLTSVFCTGSKVFAYSRKNATRNNTAWFRTGSGYAYGRAGEGRATLQFQTHFPFDNDIVYLAYAIPYTYTALKRDIANWTKQYPSLISEESLCQTVGRRSCPILTIDATPENSNKPCIFITARIHPGETPSSLVLNGLIEFLLSDSAISDHLVSSFCFQIVPMMCIDGVIEGHYRCSLGGFDLNRVWDDPDMVLHPEVWHTKVLMREIHRERGIAAYLDFHGHSGQHGSFAYGCPLPGDRDKVFPNLVSLLTENFAWERCKFSFPTERKTSGRIVARNELGVDQTFTIESSFGGIPGGLAKGVLYDLKLWKELGGRLGEGLYHLLVVVPTPLRVYAESSLIQDADEQIQAVIMKKSKVPNGCTRAQAKITPIGQVGNKRSARLPKVVVCRSWKVKCL